MITEKQMKTCDVTHRHGGNCFAVVQKLDDEYVRLTPAAGDERFKRAFLAATSLLTVTEVRITAPKTGKLISVEPRLLEPDIAEELAEVRSGIESGKLKVVATRIVEA